MTVELPEFVLEAIKCGPVPTLRPIEDICADPQTLGEQVIAFAALHLVVAEGAKIGQPLILEPFQQAFILAVFDNPHHTRFAYLSIASRNGKTAVIAVILLAYLIGPLAMTNTNVASGALSRKQAGICFNMMHKILMMSPDCEGLYRAIPSDKRIVGLTENAQYWALSSEAKTGYGESFKVILLDEAGQIIGPTSPFTEMLDSRQGSYDDALFITISTQSPSDLDYFSINLDHAERETPANTVSHVYAARKDCDLMDRTEWYRANPGLGIFRSLADLEAKMEKAQQIPAKEAGARNQNLNQRIAMEGLAINPSDWKACSADIDLEVFRQGKVSMGLDLSARNDLTAALLAAEDDAGVVHLLPFVFCPTSGIEERALRDRAPYDVWVREGTMVPIGGRSMDFDQIADGLQEELTRLGIQVAEVHYDKAYIDHFRAACDRVGALSGVEWIGVPQFFKHMGARLGSFLGLLVEERIRHGSHPALNMAVSVAVAQQGREGISALAKDKSTHRIDVLVAAVMAAWPFGDGRESEEEFDVSAWIG